MSILFVTDLDFDAHALPVAAELGRRGHEVRVFNPTPEPCTVTLAGRRGWLVDLRGQVESPFENHFDLAPWAIATARLTT